MSKTQIRAALGCCLLAAAILSWAQAVRQPGLWQMTSTMTWQKTPMPPGVTLPQGVPNPFASMTSTTQVCLTQQMINKFGAPVPTGQGACTISNIVLQPTSMTAQMTCTGKMNGQATLASSWPGGTTAQGTMHFTGTMQTGANAIPVEYTVQTTSTYKGPDCGSVKPLPMPASN